MATLSGNKIKDTYQSLVKFSDNGNITTSAKQLTDGFGNNSPMYVSTTQVGIGVTPESGLNLHVYGDAKIGSNLTVIGNLVVEGSTTTVGTDTLTVKDPLIVLANNNTSTDAVDIGFYGKYTPSGTTLYSGLFREALTGKYRLFKDLQVEPTTTVNTSGTGYAQATLIAALEGDVTGNITGNVTGNVTGNLTGNVTGNVTGDLTGDVTGDVTGDLTGNVTGGSITATTGLFTDNVNIAGTLVIDDELTVEGSAFGRIEIGGPSGGYIDLKAPHSDDYDLRLITSTGGGELLSIDTLKFYTGATTDLAFTIDASQNATFENNVTIPETPTADTHAASKGYVDAAVEGQDTLAEILANGNTSGANDIIMADNQKIYYGTGSDVEMYFDGATQFGIINDTAGGSIFLRSDSFLFRNDTNQFYSMSTTTHELKSSGTTRLNVNANGITVSGIIKSNTGSASAPAYSFDADGDIGMYRSASDELSFSTAGTKRVSIDSSGETNFLGNINIIGNGTIPRLTLENNVGEGGLTYYLTSTDNGIFGIYRGSTDVLTIDSNGDVGIGTDSAQTKLHLQDEDNALFFTLESSNTTTHKNVAIKYQNYSTGNNFWWAGLDGAGSDNASFSFKYNQNFLNEILTLDTSGNVGIGTNSPNAILEIASGNSGGDAALDAPVFRINNTTEGSDWDIGDVVGSIEYYTSDASGNAPYVTSFIKSVNETGNGTLPDGALTFGTATYNASGGAVERMRIDSSGNVGIGTTSPASKLVVRTSTDHNFEVEETGGELRLSALNDARSANIGLQFAASEFNFITGNVGIGTDSPAEKLHVENGNIRLKSNSDGNNGILRLYDAAGTESGQIYPAAGDLRLYTPNDIIMSPTGNVGIGTTTPLSKLTVSEATGQHGIELAPGTLSYLQCYDRATSTYGNMTIDAKYLAFGLNNGAEKIRFTETGNVGIGTSSPSAKLEISGIRENQIRLTSYDTSAAVDEIIGGVEFYSSDTGNEGVKASISAIAANTEGSAYMTFSTGTNTERMRISSNGNVGIGTTSPGTYLQIGDYPSNNIDITTYPDVPSEHMIHLSAPETSGRYGGGISFGEDTFTAANIVVRDAGGLGALDLCFGTGNTYGVTERMRIDSSGDLYIGGTTDYGGKINIEQGGSANGIVLNNTDSTPPRLYLRDAGGATYSEISANNNLYLNASAIGIGTTSPTAGKLVVVSTEANWTSVLKNYTAGAYGLSIDCSGASSANYVLAAYTPSGTGMFLNGSGNVGIGTTSPSYKLDVQVSGNVARFGDGTRFFRVYTDADEVSLLADGSVPMKFYTSGTERMRITSTGNILVGTTGTPNGTSVYGSAFIDGGSGLRQLFQASSTTTSVSIQRFYNPNGNVGSIQTNGSSTSYSTSSDYRLKENVVEMTGALDRVSQLKPSRFNFIADADKTVDGFLAHEVQDIVPEAITGEKDAVDEEGNPEYQGIDQSKLVPLLVGAIQELKAEIELLKTQINN